MPKVQLVDERGGPCASRFPVQRLRFEDRKDVLFNGQLAEDGGFLRQVTDAIVARTQVHGDAADVFAVQQYVS